jgi:uncharacterized linocin/CFP29 family protein
MNHLLRENAPISEAGWALLDEEARERLAPALGARKLIDFSGPHGWTYSATDLGRVAALPSSPADGVSGAQRRVLPLVELRAAFAITRDELSAADRGADDTDLGPLDRAAHQIAVSENAAVFHGWEGAIGGIAAASPHEQAALSETAAGYPRQIAAAVETLLASGVGGPYGLALGADEYRSVTGGTDEGNPVFDHIAKILDGPIIWAPGVTGAVVVSMRGGDFVFESGQDLSIGYDSHDADVVRLYLEESFSFHVATPEAAVAFIP